MRKIMMAALLGLVFATPVAAQVPDVGRLLQGLTTGNQSQDHALHDAFERGYQRGYQRGREDEARLRHSDRYDRRSPDDRRDYPDDQRP